jgi:hypothetical protein
MKTVSKRELVRNPSVVSHLRAGKSIQVEDGENPITVSRAKRQQLKAEEIEAEIQRICKGSPVMDVQEVLKDLRQ